MVSENKQYEQHTFRSFLKKYHVIIPMVQRDYAQGRTTSDVSRVRNRFLDAIKSYLKSENDADVMKMDFVYGEKEQVWSTIEANKLEKIIVTPLDGQQRLTTLYLLHWYAAKKGNINECDYIFLNNFTYDIRPSSRDFCTHLMQYNPDWLLPLHEQLIDQNWFMGEWHNDPTILGMLVMLDSINEKFGEIKNLWKILTGEKDRIVFYFLPLSENGLSDELYIKMNSRGKKLTAFEHFKAEFENLYEKDSEEARIVSHKFDVEWANTFFPYRDQDDIVDNEFMRYFLYISHILCYEQDIKKSNDEFELIQHVYNASLDNRIYLEKALDCWYRVINDYGSIDAFFRKYLSGFSYEKNKVATFKSIAEYHDTQNFFYACVKLYQVNNNFSYSDFLFLYGIITYLINKDNIKEDEFVDRLRTLRNLIWNSNSGEIRGDADYMKDLLDTVKSLMLKGNVDTELTHKFNSTQIEEEREKQKQEINQENLHKFEDHPLIYGYASGLGYNYLDLVDTFLSIFNTTPYLEIHRAMLAIGDYTQNDSNRYYMGNHNKATWSQLLHKSRNRNNSEEKTMSVLRALLQRIKDGEKLDDIIKKYLSEKEEMNKYDWRYYFVKYPDMLRGADGELTWDESNRYICTTLNKHQFNGQHWNPFLNVIYKKLSDKLLDKDGKRLIALENYGENLNILKPISSLAATGTGFIYYHQDTNDVWDVEQENSIDKVDRIAFAIAKIKKLVQENMSV